MICRPAVPVPLKNLEPFELYSLGAGSRHLELNKPPLTDSEESPYLRVAASEGRLHATRTLVCLFSLLYPLAALVVYLQLMLKPNLCSVKAGPRHSQGVLACILAKKYHWLQGVIQLAASSNRPTQGVICFSQKMASVVLKIREECNCYLKLTPRPTGANWPSWHH